MRKSGLLAWPLAAAVTALFGAPAVPAGAPRVAAAVQMSTAVRSSPAITSAVRAGVRAGSGAVVSLGTAVILPTPGVTLRRPADPRLWGYETTGSVLGVAFTQTAGTAGNVVSAPPGGRLCVFTLQVDDVGYYSDFLDAQGPEPTAAVTYGGDRVALATGLQSADQSTTTWAVAVTADNKAPIDLDLSDRGVTSTFDLRALRRTGTDPAALYRGRLPWSTDHPHVTGTLTQTGPTPYTATFQDPVTISAAYLSWFPPTPVPATQVAPAGDTYLVVAPSGGPPTSVAEGHSYQTAGFPASAVSLTLPDGQRVSGQVSNRGQSPYGTGVDLFGSGGYYYFAVPDDFTTGTIAIHATAPLAAQNTVGSTILKAGATLRVAGTVEIPVTFPAATSTLAPTTAPLHGSGGGGSPVWLIVLLAAAVVAGALIVVRGRRNLGLAARPVTRPLALIAGPAGALPSPGWPFLGPGADDSKVRSPVGVLPPAPSRPPPALDDESVVDPSETPPPPFAAPPFQPPPSAPPSYDPQPSASDPPVPDGPLLVVRLLGPLDVQGLTGRLRRRPAQRLLICLALWPERPLSADQLRNALATSDDTEPTVESVRSYAAALRRCLPDGIFPPAGGSGYQLTGPVDDDWALFQALTTQAQALPAGADRLEHLDRALRLVRGVPLAGETWAGIDQTVRHIETTIERTAADGGRLALQLRDARTAERLVHQGLLAAPASPLLWELRLGAAAAGSGVGLDRAWGHAQAALGADSGMIAATYQQLRTGQF